MKVRQILRLLYDDGWAVVRQRGSHRQLQHATKPGTVTGAGKPGDELHPKTAASIRKQAFYSEFFMRYVVIIRRTGTGYSVDVPDLPGCVATGTTIEHARQMIAEAIEMYIDMMQQSGESIPIPNETYEFAVDDEASEELCTWVEFDEARPTTAMN